MQENTPINVEQPTDQEFSDRILVLMNLLRIKTINSFASSIGVAGSVVQSFLGKKTPGRKTKPNMDTLEKIKAKYPRVNLNWLVTGEGEPLRPLKEASTTIMSGNMGNTVGTNNGGSISQHINSPEDLRVALAACQKRNQELESTVADMRLVIDVLKGQK